jgi:hypothetical protein
VSAREGHWNARIVRIVQKMQGARNAQIAIAQAVRIAVNTLI